MTFNRLIFPVMLLALGAGPGRAEPVPAQPLVTFRAVAWNRDLPEVFYEAGDKRYELALHRGAISEEQRYEGSPSLALFTEEKTADGKMKKIPLTTVGLAPPPAKNLVVVWLEKGGSYHAVVLPDATEALPPGHARFINITGRRLALQCNGGTYVIKPGGGQVVEAVRGGLGVKVAVQMESEGGWKLAAMNAVRVRANTRVTVFIADPSRLAEAPEDVGKEIVAEPLSLFVITDRIPATTAAEPRR